MEPDVVGNISFNVAVDGSGQAARLTLGKFVLDFLGEERLLAREFNSALGGEATKLEGERVVGSESITVIISR